MGLKPTSDKNRSIFAEVDSAKKPVAVPGQIDKGRGNARPAIRAWLGLVFVLTVLIVLVGGLTRLTDSGLSITEWKPISGIVPPMNAEAWEAEFAAYQQIPEYQQQNQDMNLAGFKSIYWWEWAHRVLGRVIGLVALLGFLYFLARKQIPTGWTGKLFAVPALIGMQGIIGWWMVSSGLQEGMLDVASYRLATHLSLAFVILGLTATFMMHFLRREADLMQARRAGEVGLRTISNILLAFVFLQIILGALVAGIDAGRAFPTWPLMGGGFFPPDPFGLSPWWRNFFEDAGLVQFVHRITGYLVLGLALIAMLRARRSGHRKTRAVYHMLMGVVILQILLGIMTVLYQAQLHVAITHQLMAVVLWVSVLRARFLSRYPLQQSVRDSVKGS